MNGLSPRPTALVLLTALTLAGCNQTVVLSGLSQADANRALRTLADSGIEAVRTSGTDGTYDIAVPAEDLRNALHSLDGAALPDRAAPTVADLFPADGLIVTPFELRARLAYAVDQAVRRQIRDIGGVVDAEVRIDVPQDQDRFGRSGPLPTAAAVVRIRPTVDPLDIVVKVKTLIAGAVAGLSYDRVTVMTSPVEDHSPASPPETAIPSTGGGTVWRWIAAAVLFSAAAAFWAWPGRIFHRTRSDSPPRQPPAA